MKGTIQEINQRRGMVAVLTENGDFSIFELTSEEPLEIGDAIEWKDDTSLGHTEINNLTQNRQFEVYFQNHWVSRQQLKQQLLY